MAMQYVINREKSVMTVDKVN